MNINNPTTFGVPDLTLGTSNVEGVGNAIRTGATILTFDTTLPDAITFGQSGAVGTATTASRRDHSHQTEDVDVATQAQMEAASSTSTFVTPGRAQYHPGSTKCWGYVSNDGTLRSPSYNVDTVDDDGTGIRTINFLTAMSDADYAIAVQVRTGDAVGTHSDISAIATGSFQWKIYNNSTDALQDSEGGFQAIGDQ